MSRRLRWMTPVLMGLAGIALLAIGVPKLPAEVIDLPGNGAANALADGKYVNEEGARLVLEARTDSLKRDENSRRWFALARANAVVGDAAASVHAFQKGLQLAPANGVVWAEYALALRKSGQTIKAEKALQISLDRAPHDPRANRFRRLYRQMQK